MTGHKMDGWAHLPSLWHASFSDNELLVTEEKDDEIFKRHGWNKVNSGFRFFDTGTEMDSVSPSSDDEFLQSKGWNDVDSGFRIF